MRCGALVRRGRVVKRAVIYNKKKGAATTNDGGGGGSGGGGSGKRGGGGAGAICARGARPNALHHHCALSSLSHNHGANLIHNQKYSKSKCGFACVCASPAKIICFILVLLLLLLQRETLKCVCGKKSAFLRRDVGAINHPVLKIVLIRAWCVRVGCVCVCVHVRACSLQATLPHTHTHGRRAVLR